MFVAIVQCATAPRSVEAKCSGGHLHFGDFLHLSADQELLPNNRKALPLPTRSPSPHSLGKSSAIKHLTILSESYMVMLMAVGSRSLAIALLVEQELGKEWLVSIGKAENKNKSGRWPDRPDTSRAGLLCETSVFSASPR
jgi:hypothetical protein